MTNVQQNPKPKNPKKSVIGAWNLIGHWGLVIGIF